MVKTVVKGSIVGTRSYGFEIKNWCRGAGSNRRHRVFQTRALPTELPRPGGRQIVPGLASISAGMEVPKAPCAWGPSLTAAGMATGASPTLPYTVRCLQGAKKLDWYGRNVVVADPPGMPFWLARPGSADIGLPGAMAIRRFRRADRWPSRGRCPGPQRAPRRC